MVDSDGVTDNDQSQDFEEVASSSQVLPVSNMNTCDMCASAIAQLQVAGVGQSTLNSLVIIHGGNTTRDTESG